MSPVDDTLDGIVLRWPKPQRPVAQPKKPTWRQRLAWLAFPIWIARLVAEMTGWLAILGLISRL